MPKGPILPYNFKFGGGAIPPCKTPTIPGGFTGFFGEMLQPDL